MRQAMVAIGKGILMLHGYSLNKKQGLATEEAIVTNKQNHRNDHYPFGETPKLTGRKRCIHCNSIFTVGDYKVFKGKKGNEFICCPNAPDCNGTVIDWFRVE